MHEKLLSEIIKNINETVQSEMKIMEICGTHTHAIAQYGIHNLITSHVQLLSGPGCPVCVTPESVIDAAIKMLENDNMILTTFGDLVRVKGTKESILDQREKGKMISIVYSPFDVLQIAQKHKDKSIVFLAVGFETTAPVIASVIKLAKENRIENLYFLTSLRLMPPVLRLILEQEHSPLHGILCPGHVAAVMGESYFEFIERDYHVPAVIAGFDPLDITSALHWLIQTYSKGKSRRFENLYKRSVQYHGNQKAQKIIKEVFDVVEDQWRGIGKIKDSALTLKENYSDYDALKKFQIILEIKSNLAQCICKEILMGNKQPTQCENFGRGCTPSNPMGPCMISSEGSCAAYYTYKRRS